MAEPKGNPSPPLAPGVDPAGLARLQLLADDAADRLRVPRPPVTVDMAGSTPDAHAAAAGRSKARVQVTVALTAADPATQRWFMAHEVGHLHEGAHRPVRTAFTSLEALAGYAVALLLLASLATLTRTVSPTVGLVGFMALFFMLWRGWAVCSQAGEFAADRLAAQVLRAQGQDPVEGSRIVMAQFGPKESGLMPRHMSRLATHPTAERRLAAVVRSCSVGQPGTVT